MFSWITKLIYSIFSNLLNPSRLCVCRFEPSCSSYAAQAVDLHGPFGGSWLIFRRLTKCHPWGSFGFDPVPPQPKPQD